MNKHYPDWNQEAEIPPDLNGLQPILETLDHLITKALSSLQSQEKINIDLQPSNFQATEIPPEPTSIQIREDSLLAWLQTTFNLSTFDLYILTIALTPELDKQYEQIYVYLQDNINHKRPTVDLVFSLLCSTIPEKLSRRKHFFSNAPLINHKLLHLSSEVTLLSQQLILDAQVIRLLLNQHDLDSRLVSCCQLLEINSTYEFTDNLYLQEDVQNRLQGLAAEESQKQQPLLLYFQGSYSTGKYRTAQIIAQNLEISLLIADLGKFLEDKTNFDNKLQTLFREAWFFQRLLYIDNFDILYLQENKIYYQSFIKQLENNHSITILAGIENWIPTATDIKGVITIPFTIPESEQRRKCWINQLKAAALEKAGAVYGAEEEKASIQQTFLQLAKKAKNIDRSLIDHIHAEEARVLKRLEHVESKFRRAQERNEETTIQQLEAIKDNLFPGQSLQERHDNFLNFYFGNTQFVADIIQAFDPFDLKFHVMQEE